jgi:L-fuconolactonase
MHIDAHQHFWVFDPLEYAWIDDAMAPLRRDFLPADLRPELQGEGIQGCIAVQARQTLAETRWLLELAKREPWIVGVVGWADLRSPRLRSDLESFGGDPRLVGLRHIVQDEPDDGFLLQPDFLRGISLLAELGLAYDILIYPRHLPAAVALASRFPDQRFVLDHLAKPPIKSGALLPWGKDIRELAFFPNVYGKLSGLVTEADCHHWTPDQIRPYLDVAFDCFGPRRLMLGSDWPVCTLAGGYSRVIHVVTDYLAGCSADERAAVCGGNAENFWRLQPSAPRSLDHRVGKGDA